MNSGQPKGAGLSGPSLRPHGPPFFSGAAAVFAGAVVYRSFLFSLNGAQPTNTLVLVGFYALASISAVLAVVGGVDLVRKKGDLFAMSPEGSTQLRRLTYSALAGLSLTLVSFFYIGGVIFENQQTGFPLLFSFRTDLNGYGPLNFQVLPAVLDFGFWLAICYLFLSGVPFRSRQVRGFSEALVGVSVAFFFSVMMLGIFYQPSASPIRSLPRFSSFSTQQSDTSRLDEVSRLWVWPSWEPGFSWPHQLSWVRFRTVS